MAPINNLNDDDWSADVLEWVAIQRLGLIASQPAGGAVEYMTRAHLERRVAETVHTKGKCSVPEIQETLGADMAFIRNALPSVIATDTCLIQRSHLILSRRFLDDTAREWQTLIDKEGRIALNDLGLKWNLPQEVLQEILSTCSLQIIVDPADRSMLHSHKLKDKEKAEVTQAMEKAIGPLLLSDFPIHAHRYVFQLILDELSMSQKSLGKVKGLYFVPDTYLKKILQELETEFSTNRFVAYQFWKERHVDDPRQVIVSKFPQSLCLTEIVLHESWRQELTENVKKDICSQGWSHLPSSLPFGGVIESDFQTLVKDLKLGSNSTVVVVYPFVIALGFLAAVRLNLEPDLQSWYVARQEQSKGKLDVPNMNETKVDGSYSFPIVTLTPAQQLASMISNLGLNFPETLVVIVSKNILKEVNAFISQTAQSVFVSKPTGMQDPRYLSLRASSRDQWVMVYLFYKGLSHVKNQKKFGEILQYLLDTKVEALVKSLYQLQYFEQSPTGMTELDAKSVLSLRNDLSSAALDKLDDLQKEFDKGDMTSILVAIHGWHSAPTESETSIVIREFQEALLCQIQRESDFAISLHMTVVLLFPLAFPGSLMHVSGRFVPTILKSLELFLSNRKVDIVTDLFEFLKMFQQRILVYLKTRDGGTRSALEQDLKTLRTTLNEMLK